jgi:Ala-tRNA(Pro) deacylase
VILVAQPSVVARPGRHGGRPHEWGRFVAHDPSPAEQAVYECLVSLGIAWTRFEHPPVFTVEEAEPYWAEIPATHCKNLFLRNAKGTRHYLVVLGHDRKADLRMIGASLGDDRLSFASPDRLMRFLQLTPGAVSPFGLIHDSAKDVIVVLDAALAAAERLGFHPNVNTATITLPTADFLRFLEARGNIVRRLAP